MGAEYNTYLAAHVLNEDRTITYRLLSRALKIHANKAKQMLFEFHRQQNGKKPGSVHATYIIAGRKKKREAASAKDGEDEYMQSSPHFRSSPIPHTNDQIEEITTFTMSLVREENLKALAVEFDVITSIHVYSLGPYPLIDMQLLSDSSREVVQFDKERDPLEYTRMYGGIMNSKVRRRTTRRRLPLSMTSTAQIAALGMSSKISEPRSEKAIPASSLVSTKSETTSTQSAATRDFFNKAPSRKTEKAEKHAESKPAALKRNSSSLLKAFAKSKPRLKSENSAHTTTSEAESATPSAPEDEAMKDVSDDEEDTYIAPVSRAIVDSDRRSRKDREAVLKAMMDDDDDDDESFAAPTPKDELEREQREVKEETAPEPLDTVERDTGRRRGKKRITKKKTMKDEEGYLVTVDEIAWESFSEDEVVPVKATAAPSSSVAAGKSVKKAAVRGQGSIMSFFGKPK